MRRAFELAHATAYVFAAARPRPVLVDEITFKRPVYVGDLVKFKSWVLGTNILQEDPEKVRKNTKSNKCFFIIGCRVLSFSS